MPLKAGDVLENRYRIEGLLGKGGTGAVYRAWHLTLKVPVAVKVNLLQSETVQRQFSYEASILASLRHPNLPHVNDFFSIQDQGQYLVMEYIEGRDLEQVLANQGALPVARALDWIGHVLEALRYLHSKNVIHRDVKPSNIKITLDGQVVLVDFGLAREYDPTEPTIVGARGIIPGYVPLEQVEHGRTDARTDVYSVGATLYALLTGQAPPGAPRLVIRTAQLVLPHELSPEVTPGLEAAVLRAMQTAPDDRFQTVLEFRDALIEARLPANLPLKTREVALPLTEEGAAPARAPGPAAPEEQPMLVRPSPMPEAQGPAAGMHTRRQPAPPAGAIEPQNARRVVELECWGRDSIDQIALSPDGALLAAAAGARIDLYDVGTQQEVRRIRTGGRMVSLAFSPDGATLAATFRGGSVQLWRVRDGQEVAALRDLATSVENAVFAPDGGTLALGGRDHTVRLWSIKKRQMLAELIGHTGVVTSLAFSPDGATLASGSYDGSARFWRVRDGALLGTLRGHDDWVLALALSPDGVTLATGSRDQTVWLWRVTDGEGLCTLEDHGAAVPSLAFSPNGVLLASGAWDGAVRLWRVHDGEHRAVLTGHEAVVQGLAFLPDGARFVSGSRDGTVRLWGIPPS